MTEKQMGYGRFFVQEAIRAGTWGVVFLLVMAVLITAMKQDIKEGIAFGVDRLVSEVAFVATDRVLIGSAKQLVKKGIDYSVMKEFRDTGSPSRADLLRMRGNPPAISEARPKSQ
jgi:hypothetical protein